MSDDPIQIFISYSRDDDDRPPGMPDAMGFVEYLHKQMAHTFTTSGRERPTIWRDVDNIYRGQHFWPKIEQELEASDILLVILSRNWMTSDWCRKELSYFADCLRRRDQPIDGRIIAVVKNDIAPVPRPPELEHHEGYRFYSRSGREVGGELEFFARGKPIEDRYWPLFDELCDFLLRRSRQIKRVVHAAPPEPDGPKVYVAKTASDMLGEYIRVVNELTTLGYRVVPKRPDYIPLNASAPGYIDEALKDTIASVHLLGESRGPAPEDLDPIVKLQLARAAAAVKGAKPGATGANVPFRRIIWAPKAFRTSGNLNGERDPFEVVGRFGYQLPNDKVLSEDLANLLHALGRLLNQSKVPESSTADEADPSAAVESAARTSRIFILHDDKDRPLARFLKKALWEKVKAEGILPAVEGSETERKAYDKDSIKICDAVAVCWGAASEVWWRAQARQFGDYRAFGRTNNWGRRSLVMGPPPGAVKAEFKEDPQPSEIDVIVDVREGSEISRELLGDLLPRVRTPGT